MMRWLAIGIVYGLLALGLLGCHGNATPAASQDSPIIPTAAAPGIDLLTTSMTALTAGDDCDLTVSAHPGPAPITIHWSATGGVISGADASSSSVPIRQTVNWTAPNADGVYTITCTITDTQGVKVERTLTITVGADTNYAPVITGLLADPPSLTGAGDVTITCNVDDVENDPLTFAWTVEHGTLTGSGDTVTWRAPAAAQSTLITCTVTDSHGGIAQESISFRVGTE